MTNEEAQPVGETDRDPSNTQTVEDHSARLRALLEQALPKVDQHQVDKIKDQIRLGKEFDSRELTQILLAGTDEERAALRQFFADPLVAARNQDLVLSRIRSALSGGQEARTFIERQRIVIEENLPGWVQDAWKEDYEAEWRKIDLSDRRVKMFFRKKLHIGPRRYKPNKKPIRTAAEQSNSTITVTCSYLPAYCPSPDIDETQDETTRAINTLSYLADVRAHIFTMSSMKRLASLTNADLRKGGDFQPDLIRQIAYGELTEGFFLMTSPTPIGMQYREKADLEMRAMFSALLIDDAVLALDLPASEDLRLQIWDEVRFYPWSLANTELIKSGPIVANVLRSQITDNEKLEDEFEAVLYDRSRLRALKRESLGIHKTKVRPSDQSPTAEFAPSLGPSLAPLRNRRLEILAALNSFRGNSNEHRKYARYLAKFVGDSDDIQTRVLQAIERLDDLEAITASLRSSRTYPGSRRLRGPSSRPEPSATFPVPDLLYSAPIIDDKVELSFSFTPEALRGLSDGQVRHAIENELDKFSECRELVDRKKIQNVDGVWELRVYRTASRVYFLTERDNHVHVLLVGKKDNQDADIARLPALRDRELQMFNRYS